MTNSLTDMVMMKKKKTLVLVTEDIVEILYMQLAMMYSVHDYKRVI